MFLEGYRVPHMRPDLVKKIPVAQLPHACSDFPTRLLALRALKSDVIVGLDAHNRAAQDATPMAFPVRGF